MQFSATPLAGAFVVKIDPQVDERGFFARTWCAREFAEHGLSAALVQVSISHNRHKGTLRGMHLQLPPSTEAKLVRCSSGAIYDVIVDLRPQSPTYLKHFGIELDSQACNALYVPPLMAHGFQTLTDDTDVLYQMSDFYAPQLGWGFRWNDPAFAIEWPGGTPTKIMPRDREYPDFDPDHFAARLSGVAQ